MPGGEDRAPVGLRDSAEVIDLAEACRGRFLQQDVLCLRQRPTGEAVTNLRRGADGYRVEGRASVQKRLQGRERGDTREAGHGVGGGRKGEAGVAADGRHVLVARDLAKPDQRQADGRSAHAPPPARARQACTIRAARRPTSAAERPGR